MTLEERDARPEIPARRRVVLKTFVGLMGVASIGLAIAADQRWWDHHFLPVFYLPRSLYTLGEFCVRAVLAVLGAALVLAARPRPRLGRLAARLPPLTFAATTARVLLAILLALGSSELILRGTFRYGVDQPRPEAEPLCPPDQRLGWIFAPAHSARIRVDGRDVEYAFDAAGYRVRQPGEHVDPERPTILFTGESIMAGYGLSWDESVPAIVGGLLGVQSANLAVFGYSNGQAYLRIAEELPHFRKPVAVVSLFASSLFDRNLRDDRLHFGPGLIWLPAAHRWRLAALVKVVWPYRSDASIERGIAITAAVLRANVDLARARGAEPLIVVPQVGAESAVEEMLRRRILDETGLPYLQVKLDPSWHLLGDLHPDPRAARAIAIAVAGRLQGHLRVSAN
jgi:hypothetical protein